MGYIRKEVIGNCTLYQGDCLDVMEGIGYTEAIVTDPPYGVRLGETKNGLSQSKGRKKYNLFSDTPEYVETVCVPAIELCIAAARTVAVTPGNRCMWLYPKPDDFGVWWNPAGKSFGRFGFQNVEAAILYYGTDPRAGKKGLHSSSPIGVAATRDPKLGHPCPKPLSITKWLVNKVSLEGETVMDPFMGSGTTGVACDQLQRKFIGIELDPEYFEIACKRIEQAQRQLRLFPSEKPNPKKRSDIFGESYD